MNSSVDGTESATIKKAITTAEFVDKGRENHLDRKIKVLVEVDTM